MFLADKYQSLLPSSHSADSDKNHRRRQQAGKATSRAGPVVASSFDAALAARLRGLLPLPGSPLGALARLADLLAITLGDAVPALAVGEGDASVAVAVAAHLDAGIALLDACNAIAARIDRLRRRRLLSRFALRLLSKSSSSPSSVGRARAALADRDDRAAASTPAPLPSLPFDQLRGNQLTAAARVLLAVNAVSSLAGAAAASVLGTAGRPLLEAAFPLVSGDFPWAEPFNAVSCQLSGLATATATATREVDAVDEAVGKLALVLDSEEGAVADEAAVLAATQQVEERTEELKARLDRLSDAVNGVFRAALCLRNAELGSFMAGPGAAGKTRK